MIPEILREKCVLIRDALERAETVTKVWTGPRSSDVGFRTQDGREVRISVIVQEAI